MPYVQSPSLDASHANGPRPSTVSYDKPVPRPPRSPLRTREIRAQNRRREYVERHPEYLDNPEHEFADPLQYDALIRRFQTPAEREAEGKRKGFSRVLEGDLMRGEARVAALAGPSVGDESTRDASGATRKYDDDPIGKLDDSPEPENQVEGSSRWKQFLTDRFVRGKDVDFDYDTVDFDDSYDAMERRDAEDAWFEAEDPDWVSDAECARDAQRSHAAAGETGIQDY